jgi:hypothetical protein
MDEYNCSTYNELILDIQEEISNPELNTISNESIQSYILQGCQQISQRVPIKENYVLRLVYGQLQYLFKDTASPVNGTGTVSISGVNVVGSTSSGTGTISTVGNAVTGGGTAFTSQLKIGSEIIVGTEVHMVTEISSDLSCTIDASFNNDQSGVSFSYTTTLFTKEIVSGSVLVIGSQTCIVDSVTDGYNLVLTSPATTASSQTFTIDRVVTQLPTRIYQISEATRYEGTIPRPLMVVSIDRLVDQREKDFGVNPYSNLSRPFMVAMNGLSAQRYLEIYPSLETDKEITVYGYIRINPRYYSSNALTTSIPLSQEFDPIIREYAKYKCYIKMGMMDLAKLAYSLFDSMITGYLVNMPTSRSIRTTYK